MEVSEARGENAIDVRWNGESHSDALVGVWVVVGLWYGVYRLYRRSARGPKLARIIQVLVSQLVSSTLRRHGRFFWSRLFWNSPGRVGRALCAERGEAGGACGRERTKTI